MSEVLSASLEDYLEALYLEIVEKRVARVKDIAKRLKVRNASVTGALRVLAEKKLINYTPYDVITLTKSGTKAASEVFRRHESIRDFFIDVLAVDPKLADETACKLEHVIPKKALERLLDFTDFVKKCPRAGSKWVSGFGYYCDHSEEQENCEKCIEITLDEWRNRQQAKQAKGEVFKMRLKDLNPGEGGKVSKVMVPVAMRKRLLEMGVTKGAPVVVERVAPLGDPIEIKVKGYSLSLRKEEAAGVEIVMVEHSNDK
jgi:DtxR family Mn-dependent transcriptional regulator